MSKADKKKLSDFKNLKKENDKLRDLVLLNKTEGLFILSLLQFLKFNIKTQQYEINKTDSNIIKKYYSYMFEIFPTNKEPECLINKFSFRTWLSEKEFKERYLNE